MRVAAGGRGGMRMFSGNVSPSSWQESRGLKDILGHESRKPQEGFESRAAESGVQHEGSIQ